VAELPGGGAGGFFGLEGGFGGEVMRMRCGYWLAVGLGGGVVVCALFDKSVLLWGF
jgi:hypothetical protein